MAVTLTASISLLGCGSTVSKPNQISNQQSRAAESDPNFFTGDTPLSGRYVVALALSDGTMTARAGAGSPKSGTGAGTGTAASTQRQMPLENYQEDYTDTPQRANSLCATYGGNVAETFTHTAIFVTDTMTEAQARAMSNDPEVLSVAEDFALHADSVQTVDQPDEWGLDQIDQQSSVRNNTYTYNNTGVGVHVYIMDSGIKINHPEFQGRASLDFSAVNNENPSDDYRGHGTAVASIVGGMTYGVAKGCRLHSVKVIDRTNNGYVSAVVKACDWVKSHRQLPAVVNMSFGGRTLRNFFGSNSGAQDTAARRLANSGVTVVCAAGNANIDASQYSPANVNELIVVGACDSSLARAVYYTNGEQSNYGDRIDLFAPGKEVRAANSQNYNNPISFGGTSAAAPYVAGVAALYLQSHPASDHYAVQNWLKSNATSNKLQSADLKGVNKFLFTNQ